VSTPRVGVLALQGGVAEHVRLLEDLGAGVSLIRRPRELLGPDGARVDAVVLPGGESSTIEKLLRTFHLDEPLRLAIDQGLPALGTCAGLILLARTVLDPAPGQRSLGLLDVAVRRNSWGAQQASAEVRLTTEWGAAEAAFIRAPGIEAVGEDVQVLARHRGAVVAVRQGAVIGLTFHPELTGEALFHRRLLMVAGSRVGRASLPA